MLQSEKEFTREDFESLTVDQLRKLCKGNNISYYKNSKRITKSEMIDKLLCIKIIKKEESKPFELPNETLEEIERNKKYENKKKYIENAKIGSIVAFRLPDGKVISAAIVKRSTKGRKFMVETKYGIEYKISFDDVIWVRTGKRWPKGVYLLFKKNIKNEVNENGKAVKEIS